MPEQVMSKMTTNEVAEYLQKKEVLFPPKRGNKIKAKIFGGLKKSMIKAASKAKVWEGREGTAEVRIPAPTSCYTTEGKFKD
ncbi:hypothetical protein FRX31_015777 [Thalictrum thalictroides]|uniref:Uncharacterized protein n=1 Tax=Thalictrum thalictroides TaxID=46969 RepID=A0A7J6WB27_THATH|nr:hypothetical protein FRX31_015777 [Thalictrum thalictroides]